MSRARKRDENVPSTDAAGIEQARDCYKRRAWADAYSALSAVDHAAPLAGDDLELLAMSAYLIDKDDQYLEALERAHQAHLDAGRLDRAVRCAFWLGLRLLFRGDAGRASGWLSRARRLLDREIRDNVEHGYLLLPLVQQHLDAGNCEAAYAAAGDAAAIGDRFGEADLTALARHLQGRALMQQGRVQNGISLLDEAMVAVTAGELSPLVTGLVYCSVIDGCQQVYALARAREWTSALAQWCDAQPDMVAFTGICLVHRAEIMQIHGAWQEAIEEARRACQRFSHRVDQQAAAAALYQQAEVHRLRGEFAMAEATYRNASEWGWEPQPGLALLRMAQGRTDDAGAAIHRAMGTATGRLQRVRLLPAFVEIMLGAGDVHEARRACRELQDIAESFGTSVLGAMAAQARGAVELAEGDAYAALGSLRVAWSVWQDVEAPYAAARARVLTGLACCALGDNDGAEMEFGAAKAAFERLGAAPDLVRVRGLVQSARSGRPNGLTAREFQVLRLIAAGKTNKAIATELFLSEKTINRHVSNIFDKLDVHSRAAGTAYAYEHKLI